MIRNKLDNDQYKPAFSGHETFPLKYGWLKKAHDALLTNEINNSTSKTTNLFKEDHAIAMFGVGKNMALSMKHWAVSTGIIKEVENSGLQISDIGRFLFGKNGKDPYLENPNTLWLLHWILASNTKKTLNYYLFNLHNKPSFNKETLNNAVNNLCKEHPKWRKTSETTISRDIDCLISSYTNKIVNKKLSHEDSMECPFAELSLINRQNQNDYRVTKSIRNTLNDALFIYALINFWSQTSTAQTITFETILHAEGSPGKIFCLSEDDLSERIIKLEDTTKGQLIWSQSAGLRQVIAKNPVHQIDPNHFLEAAYL